MATWYGAFRWAEVVIVREGMRETEAFLVTERGSRIAKTSKGGAWYRTRDKAVRHLFAMRTAAVDVAKRKLEVAEGQLGKFIEEYGEPDA
jgi:hypothetical protein